MGATLAGATLGATLMGSSSGHMGRAFHDVTEPLVQAAHILASAKGRNFLGKDVPRRGQPWRGQPWRGQPWRGQLVGNLGGNPGQGNSGNPGGGNPGSPGGSNPGRGNPDGGNPGVQARKLVQESVTWAELFAMSENH